MTLVDGELHRSLPALLKAQRRNGDAIGVLILDDSEFDLRDHARMARRAESLLSLAVYTYADQALYDMEVTGTAGIELLLLDVNMPRMNGFEFLRAARARLTDALPPVVMLTTSADPGDLTRAAADPDIRAYLRKPMRAGEVDRILQCLHDDLPVPPELDMLAALNRY